MTQADLDENKDDQSRPLTFGPHGPKADGSISSENPACDYTPAQYISLLFTDLGILTPAAVSDELIRLYQ